MATPTPVSSVSAIKRIDASDVQTPKATTGTTYQQVAELVRFALADDAKPTLSTNVTYNSQLKRIKALIDGLFSAVRLEAWSSTTVNSPSVAAFQLPVDGGYSVLVTETTVELVRGIRHYPIAQSYEASALFKSLTQAQEVVTVLMAPPDIPDSEFFTDPDPEADAAIVDQMLNGEVQPVIKAGELNSEAQEQPKTAAAQTDYIVTDSYVSKRLKSLQGRVLTIVEAALADKEQRNAVKTLVNKEFRRELDRCIDEE